MRVLRVMCWLQCFVFDKFEPYDTEEDLIAASFKYIEDQKLWAGMMYSLFQSFVYCCIYSSFPC